VQVDHDLRAPRAEDPPLADRLGLRHHDPVPVHVEEVVVAPPARPRLVVLGGGRLGVRCGGAAEQRLVEEAGAAVRVLQRIDQHHRLGEDEVDLGVALGREQVVRLRQRRLARRDLVAVDRVEHPDRDRQLPQQPRLGGGVEPARVGQPREPGADLLDPRHPLRRGDRQQVQRPPLPAAGVLDQPRAVGRGGGQRLQIGGDPLGRGDLAAELVAEHGARRRDGGVVGGGRCEGRAGQSAGEDDGGEQGHGSSDPGPAASPSRPGDRSAAAGPPWNPGAALA